MFAAVAVFAVTPVGNLTLLSLYLINPQITCCCASSESLSPNAAVKHAPAPLVNVQPEVLVSSFWIICMYSTLLALSKFLSIIVAFASAAKDVILIPSTIASVNNTAKIFLIFFIFLSPFHLRALPIFYCPLIWDNNVFVWQEATEKLILTIIFPAPPCICFYIRSIRLQT